MARILFLFGTTDGHTGRVAQHVAKALRELGDSVDLVDVGEGTRVSFATVDAAIVAGSVRMGRFQPKLVALVREHGDSLARLPNAFLAVSLAAAQHSASAREGIAKTLRRFSAETHWIPKRTVAVAGALLYSRYGFFTRLVMRLISRASGGDTDTSRDYEYTDWNSLAEFARSFHEDLRNAAAPWATAIAASSPNAEAP